MPATGGVVLRMRRAAIAAGLGVLVAALASCERDATGPGAGSRGPASVVLYTSVDEPIAAAVLEAFTSKTGIRVRAIGDTEATKTTGLVRRLIDERERPRAQAWWSNEPLGVFELSKRGMLSPIEPGDAAGLPGSLVGADWIGVAHRARVIAFHTGRVREEDVPRRLRDLADARWSGKVGMARPRFGTTRVQMAYLASEHGGPALRAWLVAMKANGVRLYDGNSAVVHAIAVGEITLGLTDTDDAWNARRQAWPVGMVFETPDGPRGTGHGAGGSGVAPGLRSAGPLAIPHTVARLAWTDDAGARALVSFLASPEAEALLARGDARAFPAREDARARFPELAIPEAAPVDWARVAAALAEADAIVGEVLGGR